jgi:hypothetical protein
MPAKRPKPPKPRMWRISIIKKKLEYLGRVRADDKATAVLVVASEFGLKDHQVNRLVIDESPY